MMTDGIDRIQRALEAASQARNPQDAARSIISAMAGDLSSRDLSGLLRSSIGRYALVGRVASALERQGAAFPVAAAGTEAAWWLGLVRADDSGRALRALRILTEAVE